MSQRQVNLKSGNIIQSYVNPVNKAIDRAAQQQIQYRQASEKAILAGNQETSEFIKQYGDITKSTNSQFQTQLNSYVRKKAEEIGNAKAKAESPGATKEDRENYLSILQQGQQNLNAVAQFSVLSEKNKNTYALHKQSIDTKSSLNRIERGSLNDYGKIGFENALLSNTAQDIVIDDSANGGILITLKDSNGNNFGRNISDDVLAFNQTGETIATSTITKDDLLTGTLGNSWMNETKDWKDLQATTVTTKLSSEDDSKEDSKVTQTIVNKAADIENVMLNNHEDWINSKINGNFSKNWDQLCFMGNDFIPENNKLRDLAWGTLHNSDWEKGVENLKAQIGEEALKELDPNKKTPGITEQDYLDLQKQQNDLAKNGVAKFMASRLQQQDATLSQKVTQKGKLD